ncbi:MAG: HD domain-containing protein [Myxococcota bacterium]|nr:HD domain-containing protein [bacterium]MDP6073657.1 HD domain-containing protein [Myxococcota bacterium]MDP6242048.1 HD domain-containing protein [Myxococcota bacterium]MDP7074169.1 HD domain-containing protein [Myxococcota bacterium]MDP7299824.1 HD domain-containing protein [Myxococcota bacterium]
MRAEDRRRLLQATDCAYRWHAGQCRRKTRIPYVSHLLQVQGLVLEHGGDVDQATAALLHDALEDAPDAAERAHRSTQINEYFGEGVLQIVLDCTDTKEDESRDEKRPWEERKKRYVAQLAAASQRTRLVAACDKRHNLHAIVWDVKTHGPGVFNRFSCTPEQQVWYFESVFDVVEDSIPDRLRAELSSLLDELRQLAPTARD